MISRFLVTVLILLSTTTHAHEVRPAFLRLTQQSDTTWNVHWKVPAKGDMRLGLYVSLPENATSVATDTVAYMQSGSFIETWPFEIETGLADETIRINGLSATMTDVLVRVEWLNGVVQTERLDPSKTSMVIESEPTSAGVSKTYFVLGIEHILLGIDHLLFVFALLLLVRKTKLLIATITAFTIAHSITLGAAVLGYVSMPPGPVEAIIALSIVFVAQEIIRHQQGHAGLTDRAPWLVSFSFGLLHGFGFAGALTEIGLPQTAIPYVLLFFNVGVEAGQLLFVLAMLAIIFAAKRVQLQVPSWTKKLPPYAIGSIAAFWTIERFMNL